MKRCLKNLQPNVKIYAGKFTDKCKIINQYKPKIGLVIPSQAKTGIVRLNHEDNSSIQS